ncbi:Stk1 family PASTA domain-containing Ser/Thr kinase [Latilactobacillus graminis]|uniref:non-specific serine/threonine protein kinase n=2 Tax=Latilactobacillus graminis TaxID=60519 RepID=A0AA89I1L1_9LACO|nr:Stk1 family PASTA domain-containing Ser/Thr kinase [Latilactobacillus graminis]KRM23976.1 serine threonine-protein kinase PrkC [Latilactobacillus graminis DSM 20719]QFP79860.1 Stk1 family PASTA domain-containing Ser/Thr kinase [Latilactobacillus graminis]
MMETGYAVNGRYQIIRPIGEGGMANVYLAQDLILDRQVAVKVLRLDLRNDPNTVRRFKREALATTELNHPNIVSIYDVGEENGMQYIVMEYVSGTDLKKYIVEHFPIPYQRVIDIMTQILSAVENAHAHSIIHRDLKPQNILVDEAGNIKISDFGIAIALSETAMTQTNTLLGSVHYLSPEQARGSMATRRSDIYSLGIILYEMLTGMVPFEGESAVSIAIKHFQDAVPPVRDYDPRIPQALENVVLKATAKDPDERYSDVGQMVIDLSTSLSASRAHEPKFVPLQGDMGETKVIPALDPEGVTQQSNASEAQLNDLDQPTAVQKNKHLSKKTKRKWWLFGIGIVVLVLFSIFVAYAMQGSEVTVPDVTDMTQENAVSALAAEKLKVGQIRKTTSNKYSKGHVILSTPDKGMHVKSGSTVDLTVSTGRKKYQIKDYTDKVFTDINKMLSKKGLTVVRRYQSSRSVEPGVILSQNIAAGKKVVPSKTTIILTVSSGKPNITLENLSNYTKQAVQEYVANVGLTASFSEDYSNTVDEGLVISQSPGSGAAVQEGTNVNIVLSKGRKAPATKHFTKSISIPFDDTLTDAESSLTTSSESSDGSTSESSSSIATATTNKITIYLEDSTHSLSNVFREMTITADTTIDLPFTVKADQAGRYRILRNGQEILSDDYVTN